MIHPPISREQRWINSVGREMKGTGITSAINRNLSNKNIISNLVFESHAATGTLIRR